MNIRPMESTDLDRVLFIEKSLFQGGWKQENFLQEINNTAFSFPLVAENDMIRGYAIGRWILDEFEILDLAVEFSSQRQGIGKALMLELLKIAHLKGVKKCFLEVRTTALPAQSLYLSLGFRKLNIRKGYYQNGDDALNMALDFDLKLENNLL